MPKSNSLINRPLLDVFRKSVESALPFTLKVNKNFDPFSKYILEKTGKKVSVSTLRRIFQYESETMPTLDTLDNICKALNYKNWQGFVDFAYTEQAEDHLEMLSSLRYNNYENADEFRQIFEQFMHTDYCYDITLALVQAAIRKADIPVLSKLFELPVVFDNTFSERATRKHFYFSEELGMSLRSNKELINKLIPIYAKNKFAYANYIERFVDEEELNGYYGDLLEAYHQHKTTLEANLFYHCLMCQRDFDNGFKNSDHVQFLIDFKETEPVYFIPKIRRLALLIVHYYHTDPNKVEQLLCEIPQTIKPESENCNTFCALKFSQLVFPLYDHTLIKRYLSYFTPPSEHDYRNVYVKRNMNLLKIYEAYVLCCEGSPLLAEQKLNSYNHLYFFPNFQKLIKTHIDTVRRTIEAEKRKQGLV